MHPKGRLNFCLPISLCVLRGEERTHSCILIQFFICTTATEISPLIIFRLILNNQPSSSLLYMTGVGLFEIGIGMIVWSCFSVEDMFMKWDFKSAWEKGNW